ncbi:MAG: peptidase, partial [Agathobacter sp.]|nr:peptidase [Agathobacter sp.]
MNCASLILSEDIYDFIFPEGEVASIPAEPVCRQAIDEAYQVLYYNRSQMPELSVGTYSYTAIPKCYYLCDTTALDISGITAIQNNPTLSLTGQGVFMGIIDTGIDYTNRLFRKVDGSSRIVRIW